MSTGVMITLIICVTVMLLFGTIMIAATVLSKNPKKAPKYSVCRNCAAQIKEYK